MPIPDRTRNNITNQVNADFQSVSCWLINTLNKESPKLNGLPMYTALLGEAPYKTDITLSSEMTFIRTHATPGADMFNQIGVHFENEPNLINVPVIRDLTYKREVWLSLRLPKPMPYVQTFTSREYNYYDRAKSKGPVSEFDVQIYEPNSYPLVERVREILQENYPAEFADSILRGAQLHIRLATVSERLSNYMREGVKSVGSLYLNLPVLNSIHNIANLKHVRYMREGTPPDPLLAEDLNLLSTLKAAYKASKAAGGQG